MSNPNTDPHTFEASPSVAQAVSAAQLVVQNGVGYDDFMNKIESASSDALAQGDRRPEAARAAGHARRTRTSGTTRRRCRRSPRRWSRDLSALEPAHAAYFKANAAAASTASLKPWLHALAGVQAARYPRHAGRDDRAGRRLHAAGRRDRQPDAVRAAGRHHERRRPGAAGRRPAEQPVLKQHRSRRSSTTSRSPTRSRSRSSSWPAKYQRPGRRRLRDDADPGYSYQSWMLAELNALQKAVDHGKSTTKL